LLDPAPDTRPTTGDSTLAGRSDNPTNTQKPTSLPKLIHSLVDIFSHRVVDHVDTHRAALARAVDEPVRVTFS